MAGNQSAAKTLYDKLWDDHLVSQRMMVHVYSILTVIYCMK